MYYYKVYVDGEGWIFNKRVCVAESEMARKFSTSYRAKCYFRESTFSDKHFEILKSRNPNINSQDDLL